MKPWQLAIALGTMLGFALGTPAHGATPACTATGAQTPGCSYSHVNGQITPNTINSPGEASPSYLTEQRLYGFTHAENEAAWRGKYFAGAHASAEPGVLKTGAVVSGRYEADILDRPRLANARAQATAWFYDRLTINVAGASLGQDATIHGSLIAHGGFSQVFDNLKGPAEGYALTPKGIFGFDLGASQFQSAVVPGSANDYGRINLNVQYNIGIPGYRVQTAIRSTESTPFETIAGDPFAAPIDFVIRFKSGIPFYLQAQANLTVVLEMSSFPLPDQPVGSISDLHGNFGDSFYWNGLSDAKVGGELRAFTVSSASGADWAASMAPVPEPQTYALMLAALIAMASWRRYRAQPRLSSTTSKRGPRSTR